MINYLISWEVTPLLLKTCFEVGISQIFCTSTKLWENNSHAVYLEALHWLSLNDNIFTSLCFFHYCKFQWKKYVSMLKCLITYNKGT